MIFALFSATTLPTSMILPSTMRKHYAKREINKAMVDMADLLLHLLPQKELTDMSEKEIENIIQGFTGATLASCRELADFLYGAQYTSKQYEFDGTGFKFDTSAYSVADFAVMVAPIVNTEIIAELDLVHKAADNPKYAALWLYVALHIFAAWRNTDYSRLQAPAMPYNPTITLQMIRNGTYTADDAKKVANYFIANHELRWMRPNKTKESSGIAPLYFLCPEDCKATFGLILSIATAHYNQSNQPKPFVSVVCDKSTISSFFGPHFLAACGGKNFSGRRANKALMQAVEYVPLDIGTVLYGKNIKQQEELLRQREEYYKSVHHRAALAISSFADVARQRDVAIQQSYETDNGS